MVAPLQIVQLRASEMANFSYLVYCPQTRLGAAVDPSLRPEVLLEAVAQRNITLQWLINTHGHQDHIAGNPQILAASAAKHAAHPDDLPQAELLLQDGSTLDIGNGRIEILHTPGHTPGSLVLHTGEALITGDTLFVSRCGRADLPGSDVQALYRSLLRLKKLPPQTRIYPGHDYGPTPTSTLAWELQNNDYLKCPDLTSFIKLRLG